MCEIYKMFEEFKFEEEIPKYIQIADFIRKKIDKRLIQDKEKLPSIRSLSKILNVNNVTIVSAYSKLKNEGYAYQKMGSGTYAKKKEMTTVFRKEYSKIMKSLYSSDFEKIIDFTGETINEVMFPIDDLRDIINEVLERDGANALISQSRYGYRQLISTINRVFWNESVNEEDMIIVSGAQQGIDIAAKGLLNINDNVIVEKPTYSGALSVFRWKKANIFEVGLEEDGIDLKKFEKILRKNKIRCFYTMSYFQNPTGISYSLEKKLKILELAEIYDFYIIEDDYLSELIYNKDIEYIPFKLLDRNDRVIYIKSFSKIFLPGIRLGYLIAPKELSEVLQNSKVNTDITTSSLMQRALEKYIDLGKWKDNISRMNHEYSNRYNLMKSILDRDFKDYVTYVDPKGGLSVYVMLNDKNIDSRKLFMNLRKRNVYITPGAIFFNSSKEGRESFKICFYQTNEKKIKEGMVILKEEIINMLNSQVYNEN